MQMHKIENIFLENKVAIHRSPWFIGGRGDEHHTTRALQGWLNDLSYALLEKAKADYGL